MKTVIETEVTLTNRPGLHTRPAKQFVELSSKFTSDIIVTYDGLDANGKSIMSLLGLLAFKGCCLKIKATGEDAQDATDALIELVKTGF